MKLIIKKLNLKSRYMKMTIIPLIILGGLMINSLTDTLAAKYSVIVTYVMALVVLFQIIFQDEKSKGVEKILFVGKRLYGKSLEKAINKELENLIKNGNTIMDVKIMDSIRNRRTTKEAYILYY